VPDLDEPGLALAAWRYRVIAEPLEARDQSLTAALEQAAAATYRNLQGQDETVTVRTLWRWVKAYRRGGLLGLAPKVRSDRGQLRAFSKDLLERAGELRTDNPQRATRTLIDILERGHQVPPKTVARSTLDHHLDRARLSRARLHTLGRKTFRKVLTQAPFELVIADFHHGPYVQLGPDQQVRRALLLLFLDHYRRFVVEGRYYLHEDFAALRFGFRRVLLAHGCFARLYLDNGPSFHCAPFHAACTHPSLGIELVRSKPYAAQGRGACERINRTVDEQFESEVRARRELLNLDELNAYFEAWLSERYHRDVHSETQQAPQERFAQARAALRPAPDLALVDELLRLREPRSVHRKWSTVELAGQRYWVDPALRGRRVRVLYDPFDPSYVLIRFDGRTVRRALPHQAGKEPPAVPASGPPKGPPTDYLALLRADHEARRRAELSALRLRAPHSPPELLLVDLFGLLEQCRGACLLDHERTQAAAWWRQFRPIDPASARSALEHAHRRLGSGLHLRCYLDDLQATLVRLRTKAENR
jgi:hypothetical protein